MVNDNGILQKLEVMISSTHENLLEHQGFQSSEGAHQDLREIGGPRKLDLTKEGFVQEGALAT